MSEYRDDTQETAVASDSTWLGLTTITEEIARASSVVLFGLMVLHTSSAAASDEVIDSWSHLTTEQVSVSDEVVDGLQATQLITDRIRATDGTTGRLTVVHEDALTISDAVMDSVSSMVSESATIHDEVIAQRYVYSLVVESAKASDKTVQAGSTLSEDTVTASDSVIQRLYGKVLVEDQATLADEVVGGHQSLLVLTDVALASDLVIDHLEAFNLVTDGAVIEDRAIQTGGDYGQAWTANADNWAMSRYAPYTFESLAVIDGVLYGVNDQGVFALDRETEVIEARIKTGKLDIGKGALVHPVSAYLEYSLDGNGTAEMDVTTTQSGASETYTYGLPVEQAEELTNGRFVFGRGLRGRHFSFALRLTGSHGHINDLSVMTASTKRRV